MSIALAMPVDSFRDAIRRDGRAVDANLRGFEAGRRAVESDSQAPAAATFPRPLRAAPPSGLEQCLVGLSPPVQAIVSKGLHRLVDFQDATYARAYGEHIGRFTALEGADDEFLTELSRHLAVRMSSEDTIRVAQLKLRAERVSRLAEEAKARDGDVVEVIEYLKPGPEEILSMLPPAIANPLLRFVLARGWESVSIALKIRSTGIAGFLALRVLLAFKPLRPRSLRAAQEKAWIDEWLELVERTLKLDPVAAREIVQTASLVRGYGETWRRGHENWRLIADRIVIPMLSGQLPRRHFADAVLQARIASQMEPGQKGLDTFIASLEALRD